jgi:hypothetical protein
MFPSIIPIAIVGGVLGGAAMEAVMLMITRADWARFNMIKAVGSLMTRSMDGAFRTGLILHAISAVFFAGVYDFAMVHLGLAQFPRAFFVGIGFGVIHGLIVSLMLVWVVAERHPLEEFQEAGLAVGLTHFAGHVAYGAVVGMVVALASL